jgi:ATP-dependent helicase HrpA
LHNPLPPLTFPEELPVSGKREEIAQAILHNQVIILCGETGSGKTTQLPKICLEVGRGKAGLIGHTQPRRIAASSTANA